jgi:hypothetical protein
MKDIIYLFASLTIYSKNAHTYGKRRLELYGRDHLDAANYVSLERRNSLS